MGFDNTLNQAKDAYTNNEDQIREQAANHQDKVDAGIDAASQRGQELAPDQLDGAIDQGANQGKEGFGTWAQGSQEGQ